MPQKETLDIVSSARPLALPTPFLSHIASARPRLGEATATRRKAGSFLSCSHPPSLTPAHSLSLSLSMSPSLSLLAGTVFACGVARVLLHNPELYPSLSLYIYMKSLKSLCGR